jgi:hypothetical protein
MKRYFAAIYETDTLVIFDPTFVEQAASTLGRDVAA